MYKAIRAGMFGALSVNVRMREIWDAINEIRAAIGIKEAAKETVTVDSAETVVETVADEPAEEQFDWKTSDDAAALKAFAREKFGLEIRGNKRADTVREEIEGFLSTQL